ncbi:TPA: hypothetical protein L4F62_006004 [Pseudomonas aeruginosa]|jgi:hypothetical protein|uniref:hypothetical protein n=1 Tax=Pseudomonas aeruginosa TaxID=287 RepID=UPI0024B3CA10|nr:hypothetical protein [Pseudomonas aeruginosa]CAI9794817.1 hypothetical protein PAER4782_34530 [Pseudomonas aeruginosa]CAI9912206.1 hypothetical protein PAER4782_34530 [Pseudomonas aeruginosa]HBO1619458.1 hypothetical protein [Pseudomonas aeruginosa]HBO9387085.1 hypothetical protein [Pseudomonas aeruginosa]
MGRHRVPDETLDTFGNWALVLCGINSEYGNKPFDEKCAHFLNHNRKCIDSLKMKFIYSHKRVGETLNPRNTIST